MIVLIIQLALNVLHVIKGVYHAMDLHKIIVMNVLTVTQK